MNPSTIKLAESFARRMRVRELLARRTNRRHVILNFHRIRANNSAPNRFDSCPSTTVDSFRLILNCLKNHFTIVSLTYLSRNRSCCGPLAAITFDDGWKDNYDNAFPVLYEMGIPATIFLATSKIGDYTAFWQQQLGILFSDAIEDENSEKITLLRSFLDDECLYPLDSDSYAKTVFKWKDKPLSCLENKMTALPFKPRIRAQERLFLSCDEIREMSRYGIDFGSHTMRHVILTQEPLETVSRELATSKKMLEEILCKPVNSISYPQGKSSDNVSRLALLHGYDFGYTTLSIPTGVSDNALQIPRLNFDWHFLANVSDISFISMLDCAILYSYIRLYLNNIFTTALINPSVIK